MFVNRRGFTLIEVILVIVIIAILSLVLIPNVLVFVDKNNVSMCEKLKNNIISAAEMYVSQNKYELGFSCNTEKDISFDTLVSSGNIKGPIINPINDEEVNGKVKVTYNCDKRVFLYEVEGINCNK